MNTSVDLTVRSILPSDLDAILDVERSAYDFPWSKNIFEKCLDHEYNSSVLECDDQIVGYIIMLTVLQEAHILNFCIAPDFQRRRYGAFLLRTVIDHASSSGVKQFFIEVRQSNQAAINLYKKEGFQKVGLRKDYYPAPAGQREDALIFVNKLSLV